MRAAFLRPSLFPFPDTATRCPVLASPSISVPNVFTLQAAPSDHPPQVGDLRPYLCGFFDTTSGAKTEAGSYSNIALSLGVDSPSDILFATDVLAEAQAAAAAGWRAVLVERPGNKALPAGHGFRVISSMQELLQ